MLPAQPPKSRRRAGTRKDTLRMCNWSGRICSEKRPSKVMMVSNARDPQITADIEFSIQSGVKSQDAVTGHPQRCGRLGRGGRGGRGEGAVTVAGDVHAHGTGQPQSTV